MAGTARPVRGRGARESSGPRRGAIAVKTMHVTFGIALFTVAGFVGVAVAVPDKTDKDKSTATSAPTSQPVNKYCAVEKDNEITDKGGTYVYNGKTIGFCCP